MLEKTPESPLDSKEIKPVNLKGNQPWILVGRTDDEAEALVFWSSDLNSWLIGKVLNVGKDRRQKEKRASEDEWLDSITNAMNMNLGKLLEMKRNREAWRTEVHGVAKSWRRLGDWKTTIHDIVCMLVAYLCPTLCDPMDCSLPGSFSLHGILQVFSKNIGVSCHFLLQRIFQTWGLKPGLLHCRQILYHMSHQGSLENKKWDGEK